MENDYQVLRSYSTILSLIKVRIKRGDIYDAMATVNIYSYSMGLCNYHGYYSNLFKHIKDLNKYSEKSYEAKSVVLYQKVKNLRYLIKTVIDNHDKNFSLKFCFYGNKTLRDRICKDIGYDKRIEIFHKDRKKYLTHIAFNYLIKTKTDYELELFVKAVKNFEVVKEIIKLGVICDRKLAIKLLKQFKRVFNSMTHDRYAPFIIDRMIKNIKSLLAGFPRKYDKNSYDLIIITN